MPIVWIGFAIFMLLCEGFTTQLVSIWFVLGSVCAAITTIFTSDITIQSAVFLVVSLVSLIVTRPLVKRFKKRNKTTGTNADRHIGQVGFMLTDLTDIVIKRKFSISELTVGSFHKLLIILQANHPGNPVI